MVYVGIDVAKSKHDCMIINSDGEVLAKSFTIFNSSEGFEILFKRILNICDDFSKIKVGLEATGHYGYNLLGFLLEKGLTTYLLNPLQVNLYKKGLSLRKTKTDKVDSHAIATMLMSRANLKPYTLKDYHNRALKSLTRFRFKKSQERGKKRTDVSKYVTILFPELENLVSNIHVKSIYELLYAYPGAFYLAKANLRALTNLLAEVSHGRFGREDAIRFRDAARKTIAQGCETLESDAIELQMTIRTIGQLDKDIEELDKKIAEIIARDIKSPIISIPCLNGAMGAMILAEIGDFGRFESPDKIFAYAGMSPSIYQSGQLDNCHPHMEKRGSSYLRYALFNATASICTHDEHFKAYLAKKRSEGKHYFVAISHAARKLVRLIYAIQKSGTEYIPQT